MVRVGVIGCGLVAERRHLPALKRLQDVEVVAVADTDEERLLAVADRFSIECRFTNHRTLLADSDAEAVAILTPTQSHAQIALDALEAGKHVLIEKPLGLNMEECEKLAMKGSESRKRVMVGFNMRWHSLVDEARAIIQRGTLGELKAIRSVFSQRRSPEDEPPWKRRRELGGGVLVNEGVHHFDLWHYLTGRQIEQIHVVSKTTDKHHDETVAIASTMTDELPASGVFSLASGGQNELEVYGTCGRLRVSLYRFDGLEFSPSTAYPGDAASRLSNLIYAIKHVPHAIRASHHGGSFSATFQAEWQHFIECIRDNREPACTLRDGQRALRVVIAASHSLLSGQSVCVSEAPRHLAPVLFGPEQDIPLEMI